MNDRLRGKCSERGLTRQQLADIWHCDVMTVSNKLTGKSGITCEELRAAALAFNFSEAEIMYILMGSTFN